MSDCFPIKARHIRPRELGEKLVRVCAMCDDYRRSLSPPELDAFVQSALARAMGTAGRIRATELLCNAAQALLLQQRKSQRR